MEQIRAFLSLNFPREFIEYLAVVQKDVKSSLSPYSVKWETPQKFHLTLRFLGDVSLENIKCLCSELDKRKFAFNKIEFVTNEVGFFPNAKFPNVVFLGLEEVTNNVNELIGTIDEATSKLGIKQDKKFVPHITLGRFRRDKRQRLREINFKEIEKRKIEFDSFYLMKSILSSDGSTYYDIEKFNFKKY